MCILSKITCMYFIARNLNPRTLYPKSRVQPTRVIWCGFRLRCNEALRWVHIKDVQLQLSTCSPYFSLLLCWSACLWWIKVTWVDMISLHGPYLDRLMNEYCYISGALLVMHKISKNWNYVIMQSMDIPVQKHHTFLQAHVHFRGMQLRLIHVILHIQNALILEPEWPINNIELLRTCGSYNNSMLI